MLQLLLAFQARLPAPLPALPPQVRMLSEQGVREVTLLGQNVNSYADFSRAGGAGGARPGAAAGGAAASQDPFEGVYARGFQRWVESGLVPSCPAAAGLALGLHSPC